MTTAAPDPEYGNRSSLWRGQRFPEKEGLDVNDRNMMLEATRLTRAGRLSEATALLQRMLGGETKPHLSVDTTGDFISAGHALPIVDAKTRLSARRTVRF